MKRAIGVTMAAVAATAMLAASGHAQLPKCPPGATNPLYCQTTGVQTPQGVLVRGTKLSANVCRARSRPLHLSETITAASGIRRVSVTLDGRTIKSQKSGHLQLTIGTRNLKTGVHTIKITIVDGTGHKTTRTLHFRICAARRVPTFTG
jgi:methionine-rich copper-binding protein CopC